MLKHYFNRDLANFNRNMRDFTEFANMYQLGITDCDMLFWTKLSDGRELKVIVEEKQHFNSEYDWQENPQIKTLCKDFKYIPNILYIAVAHNTYIENMGPDPKNWIHNFSKDTVVGYRYKQTTDDGSIDTGFVKMKNPCWITDFYRRFITDNGIERVDW